MQHQHQQRTMTKTYSKKQAEDNVASSYSLTAPTNSNTATRLAQIDDMKLFFATATQQWEHNKQLKRFALPAGESISCVLWNDLFFITGTDIVRSLTFRFHAFGRPVTNPKKFEEGIFSDLRNLKPGHDARLEEPKSELLDMLYKNNCIRTQKKQKVFFWFSVPHDRLFLDALERDLKREKMGMEPTTQAVAEPATTISLDSTQELFDQLRKSISQSAAATAQVIEQQQDNNTIVTDHNNNSNWSPPTPTASHTQWSSSQSRLERAASQAKRSRVNSVPASLGQQQQLQLIQQQQQQNKHYYHRLSHSSYFNQNRKPPVSPRSVHRCSPSDSKSSPIKSHDYMEPISTGVHQLDLSNTKVTTNQRIIGKKTHNSSMSSSSSTSSNSTNSSNSSSLRNQVLPSKSLDSNAMKKTKTIFGNLSLFDGSPTYKQRRRRAASVSTSALNPTNAGGPDRIRRHDKCHLRTQSTHAMPMINNSRLAMAAAKAGYIPNQSMVMTPTTMPSLGWQSIQQDYYCPMEDCRHLFKRPEHLDRHMQAMHSFVCTVCGKQFLRSENLAEHHRLEHEVQTLETVPSFHHDHQDDDSSFDDHFQPSSSTSFLHAQNNMCQQDAIVQQNEFYTSPSFDSSKSTQWAQKQEGLDNLSSRCSTLSPMQDVDFDMPDIQSKTPTILNYEFQPFIIKQEPTDIQPSSSSSSSLSSLSNSMMAMKQGSFEDDLASSSASSPTLLTFQQQVNPMVSNPKTNCSSLFAPMTLLSPFKPNYQQQMTSQQQQPQENDLMYSQQYTMDMLSNQEIMYAPFVYPSSSSYSPLNISSDMKYGFGA
ncbi:STE like transcription factor-domain-containing protein [Gilbertella persicaria]|uniref:STE like transcription factor-domain-containing protein n=1 Tax=Gilbertella persicaria TaxID=101096 RepID=UPI002220C58D|nr:STE like transcription factor-domain-containing protein [Gilbertella persicaria]KAI8091385.1 STE like transcription factor-domain-containing protein [Gilbertella persicaria]